MYDMTCDPELKALLNQFSVPMFAMDRMTPTDDFHLTCVNATLEAAGERPATDVLGKSIYDLLPMDEAEIASKRYADCAASRSVLRFTDSFTTAGRKVVWDTTLQHVQLADGGDRVVGTTIQLPAADGTTQPSPVFEDIQYYSSMADMQLSNLISTFEIFRDRELFSFQNEQHIDKLAGMCRTVQRAVEDIKRSVHGTGHADLLARSMAKHRSGHAGSDTIQALYADVTEDIRRMG